MILIRFCVAALAHRAFVKLQPAPCITNNDPMAFAIEKVFLIATSVPLFRPRFSSWNTNLELGKGREGLTRLERSN